MRPLPDRRAEAAELLSEVSREFNVDITALRDRAIWPHLVIIRRIFCERAAALGIFPSQIGDILHRDRTTVIYHTRPELRARKKADRPSWVSRQERRRLKAEREAKSAIASCNSIATA